MKPLVKLYLWTRRIAYPLGIMGLVALAYSRKVESRLAPAGPWTKASFGLLTLFFVLLFSSYVMFVAIKMQRQREAYRQETRD